MQFDLSAGGSVQAGTHTQLLRSYTIIQSIPKPPVAVAIIWKKSRFHVCSYGSLPSLKDRPHRDTFNVPNPETVTSQAFTPGNPANTGFEPPITRVGTSGTIN